MHEEEEEEEAVLWASSLGFLIDGAAVHFAVTPERAWKLRHAFLYLERRLCVSGVQLERLVGHAMFACTAQRELLGTFSSVYAFIERNYRRPFKSWPSCAQVRRQAASLVCFASRVEP